MKEINKVSLQKETSNVAETIEENKVTNDLISILPTFKTANDVSSIAPNSFFMQSPLDFNIIHI